jgi:hypothetical protein
MKLPLTVEASIEVSVEDIANEIRCLPRAEAHRIMEVFLAALATDAYRRFDDNRPGRNVCEYCGAVLP